MIKYPFVNLRIQDSAVFIVKQKKLKYLLRVYEQSYNKEKKSLNYIAVILATSATIRLGFIFRYRNRYLWY